MTATGTRVTTVKNLKLAHKMLVLSAILMGSMLAVAFVAVNQLSELNTQIRQLVDRTILKREVLADLHTKLLASIRAQKNAIIVPGRRAVEGVGGRVRGRSSPTSAPPWSGSRA